MTKLAYFEVAATDCDIRGGEVVMQGDKVVGACTSGGYSHATGKSLAFAYVEAACSSALEVVILGDRWAMHLLGEPAWDSTNTRHKS